MEVIYQTTCSHKKFYTLFFFHTCSCTPQGLSTHFQVHISPAAEQQLLNRSAAQIVCRAPERRHEIIWLYRFNIMDFRGRLSLYHCFYYYHCNFSSFCLCTKKNKQIIHFFRSWSPLPTPNPPLQLQFAQNTFKINVNYSNVKRNNVK